MPVEKVNVYEFGPFRLETGERRLLQDGRSLPLTPKMFDMLLLLVENRDHLLEKSELMERLWPGVYVDEANLTRNVSDVRKLLGDGTNGHRYIQTVPKRGYRFIAPVREAGAAAAVSPKVSCLRAARWTVPAVLVSGAALIFWLGWRETDGPTRPRSAPWQFCP